MKEIQTNRGEKMLRRALLSLHWIIGPVIVMSFLSGKPTSDFSNFASRFFIAEGAVDVEREKKNIENSFDKAQDLLSRARLQDLRGTIDLLDLKTGKIKGDISAEEAASYSARIDKIKKSAIAAEDSLVNVAYTILSEKGSDSALSYTGNELRLHGVPEKKISAAEKKILKDGPAIKQAKDQETIARLVKMLTNGENPDASTDRFLLQSAQRIVKAHTDSVKAIENVKNKKEMEDQKREEKARLDKEKKEKKLEEDRQMALKKEEEKKKQDEDIAEKKRIAEERDRTKVMREAQERAKQDSIETARKAGEEKEALRREAARRLDEAKLTMNRKNQDEEIRQKKQVLQEKARRDSIEAQRKTQDELASHQAELRQMMQDELKEKQRKADQDERQNKMLLKQQAERQERARKDSIEAYRKEQESLQQQERERRAQMVRSDKERSRSRSNEDKTISSPSSKPENAVSEAERWGTIGGASQKNDLEEKREKERLAKLLEEERQKKNLRELQDVQRLAKQEKVRQDSIDAQRRLQEQQDNQRRIVEDRKLKAQAEKDRRLAEEQKKRDEQQEREQRIAEERKMKVQAEKDRRLAEEQRKQEELENQRRITEERKMQALQEKERRVATEVKERSSRADYRQGKFAMGEENARKISADATKPDMEQDEIQRLLENVRKEKERLTRLEQQLQQQIVDKQERARQDSAEDSAKRYRKSKAVARTTEPVARSTTREEPPPVAARPSMSDPDERRRILQNDEERKRQLLALQEKARIDYQKKLDEERAKLEKDRQRRMLARRQTIISPSSGKGMLNVQVDADAAKYDAGSSGTNGQASLYFSAPEERPQVSTQRKEPGKIASSEQPQSAKNQQVDWKSKEKRRRAEKFVADIYKLLEKNQVKKARQSFDANRDYIAQYSDVEVSNMLEQSIITSETAASKATSVAQSSSESSDRSNSTSEAQPRATQSPSIAIRETPAKAERTEPMVSKAEPAVSADVNWEGNELEYISRINGFVRDNNGKAAYREFKKVEEQLKNYFTTEEFNHFKSMVENANRSGD
jgi:hypothetical protein